MQINGEIYKIGDTQKVSDRFSKREFILITEKSTPYPQHVKMEVTQDNCNKLNSYSVGDEVSVDFNIRGRLHNGTNGEACYVTLQVWKISGVSQFTPPAPNVQAENHGIVDTKDYENLPF